MYYLAITYYNTAAKERKKETITLKRLQKK